MRLNKPKGKHYMGRGSTRKYTVYEMNETEQECEYNGI
jgi:hypothetical protein